MHHEQDMRKMGGLKKFMPDTFLTAWVGTLALVGFPGFSGFFSKDMIIEAVHHSKLPGAGFAYLAVLFGVFVTSFYSFRLLFLTFYGKPRMDDETLSHVHESPWVVTVPLVLLAIPSMVVGFMTFEPVLFGGYFTDSIKVLPAHDVVGAIRRGYHGIGPFVAHGLQSAPFLLAVAGFVSAWFLYIRYPQVPALIAQRLKFLYNLLLNKYYVDEFNEFVFARGARLLGRVLWREGDVRVIDGLAVNGTARVIGWVSSVVRHIQTGYVYHYAFAMILGLFLLITFFLHR
jgi:NADH-quinone oxidoreductase subunit L